MSYETKSNLAAVYARYSTDQQRPTSIDDQIRRCREVAERYDLDIPDAFIFQDSVKSGSQKATVKRTGYFALLELLDSGKCAALIVDEPSRFSRGALEFAKLAERIEKTGLRLLTADGFDSTLPGWQLTLGIKGLLASYELDECKHRVPRGMVGQLERGFMIAAPPFGYRHRRVVNDRGQEGTIWEKHPEEAAIIREMYRMRRENASFAAIARYLNKSGIRTPREGRKGKSYWRPPTVFQLLAHPTYKGEVVWNGSAFSRAKARKEGRKLSPRTFRRPELQIVDDETWNCCNPTRRSRRIRGGNKRKFAGLIVCGTCEAILTVGSHPTFSLYCAQCAQARTVGMPRKGGSISSAGINALITHILDNLIDDAAVAEFRCRLKKRSDQGLQGDLENAIQHLKQTERALARLAKMLADLGEDEPAIEHELRDAHAERKMWAERVDAIKRSAKAFSSSHVASQLKLDPRAVLRKLLERGNPETIKAVLSKVFPRIVYRGKQDKHTAVFEVDVSIGGLAAETTGTPLIDQVSQRSTYHVISGPHRPSVWRVVKVNP